MGVGHGSKEKLVVHLLTRQRLRKTNDVKKEGWGRECERDMRMDIQLVDALYEEGWDDGTGWEDGGM